MQKRDKPPSGQPGAETDRVRKHYEKWPFPNITFEGREGLILLRHLHEILIDGGSERKKVIDIGCGTGHGTIAIARHFPDVQFVGLDVSATSIEKANHEAEESALGNVGFRHGDIRDPNSLPSDSFDLAFSLGVLHHIENDREAFANLTGLIERNGAVILWLYGRYGRMRHNLNQAFIDIISRDRSHDERERVAMEFVDQLGERYAVNSGFYTPDGSGTDGLKWLMNHRQWLADQMIPAYERCYTMTDILDLFREHGVSLRKWLGVATEFESYTSSQLLCDRFNSLSAEERLVAIDYLIKPEYYFVSGQKIGEPTHDCSGNQRI